MIPASISTRLASGKVVNTRVVAKVYGLPETELALLALQARINLACAPALRVAGETVEEMWKALVPVQDGNYRRAISTEVEGRLLGASGDIGVRHLSALVAHTAHPENEQPYLYARRLEYGGPGRVSVYGRATVSAVWRAFPSARPAADSKREEAVAKASAILAAAARAW